MQSQVLDDSIDDFFLNKDHISKFEINRSRKYENQVNAIASELIAFIKKKDLNKKHKKDI